jgi:putative NADPH-quinone reductase
MKHLVIVTHPDIENSTINKTWIDELSQYNQQLTIHQLYKAYPDYKIDIQKEQELLIKHDQIIFQFPIHWFSTPFLLKKWMDEVLAYGWAFGPNGENLKGKKVRFAISTGGNVEAYSEGNSIEDLLKSLTTSFLFCGSEVLPLHVFHGAGYGPTKEQIENNAKAYLNTILN